MSWTEIVLEVPRQHAELLSDALMEAGALSVSVEDADEGTDAERALFGEPGMEPEQQAWERSRVIALAESNENHAELVAVACAACELTHPENKHSWPFTLREVAEQDWVRLTQSQFEPIHIGERIWVVPSWHAAPDANALVLELDPGLAFGTGSHPTTRLCMEWLEKNTPQSCTVLDYGCGSGILAMVADKLGASSVHGVDIDPQAIESARYNAERNACTIDYFLPEEFGTLYPHEQYDYLLANILASPLKLMAPMLCGRLKKQGKMVLSGVLARQAEEVIHAYQPFIQLAVWAEHEGWVALAGQSD